MLSAGTSPSSSRKGSATDRATAAVKAEIAEDLHAGFDGMEDADHDDEEEDDEVMVVANHGTVGGGAGGNIFLNHHHSNGMGPETAATDSTAAYLWGDSHEYPSSWPNTGYNQPFSQHQHQQQVFGPVRWFGCRGVGDSAPVSVHWGELEIMMREDVEVV